MLRIATIVSVNGLRKTTLIVCTFSIQNWFVLIMYFIRGYTSGVSILLALLVHPNIPDRKKTLSVTGKEVKV